MATVADLRAAIARRKDAEAAFNDPAAKSLRMRSATGRAAGAQAFIDEEENRPTRDRVAAGLTGAAKAMDVLGLADEIQGVGGALGAAATLSNPIDGYTSARDDLREKHAELADTYPGETYAGDLVGTVGPGLISLASSAPKAVAAAIKAAPSLLKIVGQGSGVGGAFGAASALGHAEGDLGDQAAATGVGGLVGAGLGGVGALIPGATIALAPKASQMPVGAGLAAAPREAAETAMQALRLAPSAVATKASGAAQVAGGLAGRVNEFAAEHPILRAGAALMTGGTSEAALGASKMVQKGANALAPKTSPTTEAPSPWGSIPWEGANTVPLEPIPRATTSPPLAVEPAPLPLQAPEPAPAVKPVDAPQVSPIPEVSPAPPRDSPVKFAPPLDEGVSASPSTQLPKPNARINPELEAMKLEELPREMRGQVGSMLQGQHGTAPWQAGELGGRPPEGAPFKAESRTMGIDPHTGRLDPATRPAPSSPEGAHTPTQETTGTPFAEQNPIALEARAALQEGGGIGATSMATPPQAQEMGRLLAAKSPQEQRAILALIEKHFGWEYKGDVESATRLWGGQVPGTPNTSVAPIGLEPLRAPVDDVPAWVTEKHTGRQPWSKEKARREELSGDEIIAEDLAKADKLPKSRAALLQELLEASSVDGHDFGPADTNFAKWLAGGKRGPRPEPWKGGELDAFAGVMDKHKPSSLLEAFMAATSKARGYRDLAAARRMLAEALGVENIALPDHVQSRHIDEDVAARRFEDDE